jgi:hypothetical protein
MSGAEQWWACVWENGWTGNPEMGEHSILRRRRRPAGGGEANRCHDAS